MRTTRFVINGSDVAVAAAPETTLLWVIREHLQLAGTKYACGVAQCGACTVHVDGEPHRGSGRRLTFGEIACDAVVADPLPSVTTADLKAPAAWRLIGKRLRSLPMSAEQVLQALHA